MFQFWLEFGEPGVVRIFENAALFNLLKLFMEFNWKIKIFLILIIILFPLKDHALLMFIVKK